MLKAHALETERAQIAEWHRRHGLRLHRNAEDVLEHVQRGFGLTIDVDDVPQLLKRSENEERVDEQREELSDGDRAREDQVQHQEHDARAKKIHQRSLNEAETSQVTNLLQLQRQDLRGRGIEPLDFLLPEPE